MNKPIFFLFLVFLFDFVFPKLMLKSKLNSLRNETFFTSLSDKVFLSNDTSLAVPSNWGSYADQGVIYLQPNGVNSTDGIISIRKYQIPENLQNKTAWYTGIIEQVTGNGFADNIYLTMNSFNIGDFEGGRYIFRKMVNNTVFEGYVAMMVNNSTLYIIFGSYDIKLQTIFRSGVETAIATLQQGQAPAGIMANKLDKLIGCWESYESLKDFTGNFEIFRTMNFTSNYDYSMVVFTYNSLFGESKTQDTYIQKGNYRAEGNIITLKNPNNRTNIVTFDIVDDAVLLNDKLYVKCN
jgi:hypothetical protein